MRVKQLSVQETPNEGIQPVVVVYILCYIIFQLCIYKTITEAEKKTEKKSCTVSNNRAAMSSNMLLVFPFLIKNIFFRCCSHRCPMDSINRIMNACFQCSPNVIIYNCRNCCICIIMDVCSIWSAHISQKKKNCIFAILRIVWFLYFPPCNSIFFFFLLSHQIMTQCIYMDDWESYGFYALGNYGFLYKDFLLRWIQTTHVNKILVSCWHAYSHHICATIITIIDCIPLNILKSFVIGEHIEVMNLKHWKIE